MGEGVKHQGVRHGIGQEQPVVDNAAEADVLHHDRGRPLEYGAGIAHGGAGR